MSKTPHVDHAALLHDETAQHNVTPLEHFFKVTRRDLFKLMGAGLVVGFCPPALAQKSGRVQSENASQELEAWLHIGGDGKVTVYTGKVEMGQNIRTSLAQQVAEELRVPFSAITMVMGDTELTPFDAGTFGSRSTPQMGTQLRHAAATARELLLAMAAENWKAERSQLVAKNGAISNPKTGQNKNYAELTRGQKLIKTIGDNPALMPATEWQIAGTTVPKADGKAFVTGAHKYTSDMVRPGMLHGKVLRPQAFNATLTSLDMNGADKLPGVRVVRDGDFIGVVAGNPALAEQALELLKPQWKSPPEISDKELFDYLRKNPDTEARGGFGGRSSQNTGSIESAMASAAKTLSESYTVAYIQHAPLEPRAAVAEWQEGGKLMVWTGTQRPFGVKQELAAAFHLSEDKVRVVVPDTGSAYGGKHTGECAVEAARLSKAAGKPVKLVWTREEEFTWAYFRPSGVIDVKSAIAADGTLLAWEFHNYNSGPSAIDTPYTVANKKIEFHPTKNPPLRQGSYRGLAATANHFARESHMDELAHLASMDPLQFRLKNLSDPRLRAAFETAAQKFGWGKRTATPERGFGLAGGIEKGGYVAACAEVALDKDGKAKIVRVVEAFDCGAVINPSGLRNQISGSIVQGIGGALFEAVHFENGRVTNPHFREYPLPRFRDTPIIEVEIIDRKDQRSMGAGETPIVALAPAVANAIFNASGKRLRSMPLMPG
jgi:CO/xanthine dehydrogenase Mo-binding subunit